MIFLLVSGLAVLLAVLRVQTMRVGEPAVIRSALVRGGLAYLAFWIVGTGILGPAGPLAIPGVASRILLDLGWILSALLAVILYLLGMATGGSVWALLRRSFQALPRTSAG